MTQGINFAKLERKMGYVFKNKKLLETALIHSSHLHDETENNERLEFHGDRVLALIIVDYLTNRYPMASVGELALRVNRVVSRKTCAEVARSFDLGKSLILGPDARHSGIRNKSSVQSCAMEALIGAVYLDGGLEEARKLVLKLWYPHFSFEVAEAVDPKSKLQEMQQAQKGDTPSYQVLAKEGPNHAPEFLVEVSLSSGEKEVSWGNTIKDAERSAAIKILTKWKVLDE